MRNFAVILAVLVVGTKCQFPGGGYGNMRLPGRGMNFGPGTRSGRVNVCPGIGINHVDVEVTHVRHGDHVDTITRQVPHVYTGNGMHGGLGHGNHGYGIGSRIGRPGVQNFRHGSNTGYGGGNLGRGINPGFGGPGVGSLGHGINSRFGGHGHEHTHSHGLDTHGHGINPGFGGHGLGSHGHDIHHELGGHWVENHSHGHATGFGGFGTGHDRSHHFGSVSAGHGHSTDFVETSPGVYQRSLGHHFNQGHRH